MVEQILDTPELWNNNSSGGGKAVAKSGKGGGAGAGERTMPGNIDLRDEGGAAGGEEGGCMC